MIAFVQVFVLARGGSGLPEANKGVWKPSLFRRRFLMAVKNVSLRDHYALGQRLRVSAAFASLATINLT